MEKQPKCFKVETDPTKIDWDGFEKDVITRMRLLKASWDKVPAPVRDQIYVPLIRLLGKFCASVEIQPDGTTK